MPKTYVLDTNVLIGDSNSIFSFDEHTVIIPLIVLEELDRHKSGQDEVSRNARAVSRSLDTLRKQGSLMSGITLPNGGVIRVSHMRPSTDAECVPSELRGDSVDNMLIAFMLSTEKDATLVTCDINVRIKCDSLNIKCEDYVKTRTVDDAGLLYRGVSVAHVEDTLVGNLYDDGSLSVNDVTRDTVYSNQIVVVKSVDAVATTIRSAITKRVGDRLVLINRVESAFGLKPRNKEQTFALDLLFDENVRLVTLVGSSGCGKTLLSLAAALEQLKGKGEFKRYNKLIVTRPIQPVGRDLGYLPGTISEKMEPWIAPIRDNLTFLFGEQPHQHTSTRRRKHDNNDALVSLMMEHGEIEIEAITYIRGRSIPNAFMLVDEAQNLSVHELKTILTRVGEGTKVVLTGDIEQIDDPHIDVFTNGLTYAVERFKEYPIAGHVTLVKGERSTLATLSSRIL
jgi:PhoH-like ATPase